MNYLRMLLVGAVMVTAFGYAQSRNSTEALSGASEPLPAEALPKGDQHISPFPIRIVNPKFPAKVKKKEAKGEIVLHGTVAVDGNLKDISMVSGDASLADATIAAMRQWRYLPAIRNGTPVEESSDFKLKYDLSKGATRPEEPIAGAPTAPSEDLIQELASGEVVRFSPGVKPPQGINTPDPEYSEIARRDKSQGDVLLGLVVGPAGNPRSVWVVRALGKGLDEKSVEAVKQWKFAPATKNGAPVAALINVEVNFRLY